MFWGKPARKFIPRGVLSCALYGTGMYRRASKNLLIRASNAYDARKKVLGRWTCLPPSPDFVYHARYHAQGSEQLPNPNFHLDHLMKSANARGCGYWKVARNMFESHPPVPFCVFPSCVRENQLGNSSHRARYHASFRPYASLRGNSPCIRGIDDVGKTYPSRSVPWPEAARGGHAFMWIAHE